MTDAQAPALSGLVVIDLTRVRAGPTCVRQFADWGAEVVKVEIPASLGETDFSTRHDPDFQNLHRNKRSIGLDLKKRGGLRVLEKLVEGADILVENYRPNVKNRLGIDYKSLRCINPKLIYTSISGFGQDGPYRDRPGVDQIAQGMGGLMSVTGESGRGPMRAGTAIADLSAGLFGALGTLIALIERERSGEGQWVQTSLLESQIFMLDFQASRYLMAGELPKQEGNNHPTSAPTGRFKTSDGYINIAPPPPLWARFCEAIDREDLRAQPEFSTPEARRENRNHLNDLIEEITVRRSSSEWIEHFNNYGVPCGPIYSLDQTFSDAQVQHLGIAQTVPSPKLGDICLVGQPVRLSRTPSKLEISAPECGEHTESILTRLGYSGEEIEQLRAEGAID